MRRWGPIIMLVLFVFSCLVYGINEHEKREALRKADPIKAELVVYTDLPHNVTAALASEYEHTNHVRINFQPLTDEQMISRLKKPLAAQSGDLVLTNKDNLVMATNNKLFHPVLQEGIDEVSDRFKNTEGMWVGLWYDPVIFAQSESFYNKQGKSITNWKALTQPGDWQLVMTDFVASQAAANILYSFIEVYGEEGGIQYFAQIKPHVSQYSKFLTTPIRLTSLGEVEMGIGNYSDGKQHMMHNYPVKIIFPVDGSPYYLTGVGVLANSKQLDESEAFIAWLLTKKTAQFMIDNGFYYGYTNPEVPKLLDSLGREVVLWDVKGGYLEDGKKVLLNKWIEQVRFRKGI